MSADKKSIADTAGAKDLPPLPEPIEIDWPELHSHGLGCGIEDRNITDRYEAAEYGWQDGVDRAIERVPEELFTADQMREYACAAIATPPAPSVADAASVELPPRVIDRLYLDAGVSSFHPDGDQQEQLHAFARAVVAETLARLPAPVVPDGDGPDHDDDIAVDVFARVIKTKMAEQRDKGYDGWTTASPLFLSDLLHKCVSKGDPRDTAIVSMMLWSLKSGIAPPSRNKPVLTALKTGPLFEIEPTIDGFDLPNGRLNLFALPAFPSLTLTARQLLEALDFAAPDREADDEQLETEVTISKGVGHEGDALYGWLTECPEEGSTTLTGEGVTADPWHSIGTAPRDGRTIMLRFGEDGVAQGRYAPVATNPRHPWVFIDKHDENRWFVNRAVDEMGGPSHWMPMPGGSRPVAPRSMPQPHAAEYRPAGSCMAEFDAEDAAIRGEQA